MPCHHKTPSLSSWLSSISTIFNDITSSCALSHSWVPSGFFTSRPSPLPLRTIIIRTPIIPLRRYIFRGYQFMILLVNVRVYAFINKGGCRLQPTSSWRISLLIVWHHRHHRRPNLAALSSLSTIDLCFTHHHCKRELHPHRILQVDWCIVPQDLPTISTIMWHGLRTSSFVFTISIITGLLVVPHHIIKRCLHPPIPFHSMDTRNGTRRSWRGNIFYIFTNILPRCWGTASGSSIVARNHVPFVLFWVDIHLLPGTYCCRQV